MHRIRSHRILLVVLASLVVIACTPSTPAPTVIRGTVYDHGGLVPGVGLMFADPSIIASEPQAVSPHAVYPFPEADGIYLGAFSSVNPSDGTFTVTLPTGADLPEAALLPAVDFLAISEGLYADCALSVSDPNAEVLFHIFEGITLPGLYALTLTEGLVFALASDAGFNFSGDFVEDLGGRRVISWLYASQPVSIATPGGGCRGVELEGPTVAVDLKLVAGWNQVAWHTTVTAPLDSNSQIDSLILRNDATRPVVLTPIALSPLPEPCSQGEPKGVTLLPNVC